MQPIHKTCLLALAGIIIGTGSVVNAQPVAQSNASYQEIKAAAATVSSPEFVRLREAASRQNAAVAQAAENSPRNYGAQLVNSPTIDQIARSSAQSNKRIEQSVGIDQIAQSSAQSKKLIEQSIGTDQVPLSRLSLPGSLEVFASNLKNGKFVTVSDRGPEIIVLIRMLSARNLKDRQPILQRIQSFSQKGYPEAMNFVGVVFEHGMFNTPRDIKTAATFYKAAAQKRYQPALYNLAGLAYFGKVGVSAPREAEQLLATAAAIGAERSNRVCGMASFLQFRQGKRAAALTYAKNCYSPLAGLANAGFAPEFTVAERTRMLRQAIAAGADDGFPMLVSLVRPDDKNFMFCKYRLLERVRLSPIPAGLREAAANCHAETLRLAPALNNPARPTSHVNIMGRTRPVPSTSGSNNPQHEMAIMGITGFVSTEAAALAHLRKSDRFRHTLSVPFLPFDQQEVNSFQQMMFGEK